MNAYFTWDTVRLLLPELLLIALATIVYVGGAFRNDRGLFNSILLLGLGGCAVLMVLQDGARGVFSDGVVPAADGPLIVDAFGHTIRWLTLVVGALLLFTMWRAASEGLATDYVASLFLILAGMMLVARAGELVLVFVSLELVSIPTYIMLFIGRRNTASREATAMYFYLSILASAMLLYGFTLMYGATGSMRIAEFASALLGGAEGDAMGGGSLVGLAPIALVLIFAGLGFKLAAVPFHFYAPDVYEGTTAANAGLLSVAPKVAGLVVLMRIVLNGVGEAELLALSWRIALAIALITMTLGNVLALLQNNVRRMMAYSSIAHAGYLLIGIAVATAVASGETSAARVDGASATLFYLVVYALATLGVFSALAYLANDWNEIDRVDQLAGLGRSHPLAAIAMAVCLFSLTGVPPLAGFWGKLSLLAGGLWFDPATTSADTRNLFLTLVIVGAINAAISAAYYLRLVGVMYFRSANGESPRPAGGAGPLFAAVLAAAAVVAIGVAPGRLYEWTNRASEALKHEPVSARRPHFVASHDTNAAAKTLRGGATEHAAPSMASVRSVAK